jgi:secondary thiamine-phosphate synthase enzyme
MPVKTFNLTINTEGWGDTKDLTPDAEKYIKESGLSDGILTVFVPGSTGAVTTIEFESGVVKDLAQVLEKQVPQDGHYHHNERWHDGNGFSHVRSALVGPSLTVPFSNGKLTLGTWQQIILLDFDNNPRSRKIVFQIMGE